MRSAASLTLFLVVVGSQPAGAAPTPLPDVPFLATDSVPPPNVILSFDNTSALTKAYLPRSLQSLGRPLGPYWDWVGVCKTAYRFSYSSRASDPDAIRPPDLTIGEFPMGENVLANRNACGWGEPPMAAVQINRLAYDPTKTYTPPLRSLTTRYSPQDPTQVMPNGFGVPTADIPLDMLGRRINLNTEYPELVFCRTRDANPNDPAECKSNGRSGSGYDYPDNVMHPDHRLPDGTPGPVFLYGGYSGPPWTNVWYDNYNGDVWTGDPVAPNMKIGSWSGPYPGEYPWAKYKNGPAFYYTARAKEYCSDRDLGSCIIADAPTGGHPFPAYIRYCSRERVSGALLQFGDASNLDAARRDGPASTVCQREEPTWSRGLISTSNEVTAFRARMNVEWIRTDIVSGGTYPAAATRMDCSSSTCTYQEELVNYANWYAYYRTGVNVSKVMLTELVRTLYLRSVVARVGVMPYGYGEGGTAVGGAASQPYFSSVDALSEEHGNDIIAKINSTPSVGNVDNLGTVLQALTSAPGYLRGTATASGFGRDPVIASCQTHLVVAVDGGRFARTSSNTDNLDSGWSTRAEGAFDGGLAEASGTLADEAMKAFAEDLRGPSNGANRDSGVAVFEDNVPRAPLRRFRRASDARHQHLKLHGLSFAAVDKELAGGHREGTAYLNRQGIRAIKDGRADCGAWSPQDTCNWPFRLYPPGGGEQKFHATDLLHATVNGRGVFTHVRDFRLAQLDMESIVASAYTETDAYGSAPTFADGISEGDPPVVYMAGYKTHDWTGYMTASSVNAGGTSETVLWQATAPPWNDRKILTHVRGGSRRFEYSALGSDAVLFEMMCARWAQCDGLSPTQRGVANDGQALVSFLKGDRTNDRVFREWPAFTTFFGDFVRSQPTVVDGPRENFRDPGYDEFKRLRTRERRILIGSNSGVLHAFDATGVEKWGWIPRMLLPEMYRLADDAYSGRHRFFINATPRVGDAFIDGNWRTVLVSGLGEGGRGYFAVDITDENNPVGLWEVCAVGCDESDSDIGYSFGQPVITKRPDGKWVALLTSGLNNVAPGDGLGYLFVVDLADGRILEKRTTGVGGSDPSGFTHIAAWADEFSFDNKTTVVYGGDLNGNLWKFDLREPAAPSDRGRTLLAVLKDADGRAQAVTTRPEIADIGGRRVVIVGTGQTFSSADIVTSGSPSLTKHSVYALRDAEIELGNARDATNIVRVSLTAHADGNRTAAAPAIDWAANAGWYADFPGTGERTSLIPPTLYGGSLFVYSEAPSTEMCGNGGTSWEYAFNLEKGTSSTDVRNSTGVPGAIGYMSSNGLRVGASYLRLPIGARSVGSYLRGRVNDAMEARILSNETSPPKKLYWRELTR